jgi:hypothetical protein
MKEEIHLTAVEKNKKLDAIKNEKNDFHPVLENLLTRLPNVLQVEYRHGSNEKGADFVFEMQNSLLGSKSYVGVVAKCGDIKQGDYDVDRQIDECFITRTFDGGRQKIRISEIWVITNGRILPNAQDRFNEKYEKTNIQYIQRHNLRDLIDKYLPTFWSPIPIDLALELSRVRNEVEQIDNQYSLLPTTVESFYIEQTLFEPIEANRRDRKMSLFKKRSKIDIISAILNKKAILVEGDVGVGKSKLLRNLAKNFSLDTDVRDTSHVPIYCPFWTFQKNYQNNPDKIISEYFKNFDKQTQILVLFLDGFDESELEIEERVSVLSELRSNIDNTPYVKIVVCSRPLSGREALNDIRSKFYRLDLQPLNFNQVIKFIVKICETISSRPKLLEDLKKSPLFNDLPKTPIAAILLAKLLAQTESEIPSSLPELYSQYSELALGRWDEKKKLQSEKMYEAMTSVLSRLAEYMVENQIRELAEDEVKQRFESYMIDRNYDFTWQELFKKATSRTSLLTSNPITGTITFRHWSFAEYLCALRKEKDKGLVIDERVFGMYWSTVYYFYFGIKKDCPDTLDELLKINPSSEQQRWGMFVNYPNYLMGAFSTPYHHIKEVFRKTFIDAIDLYFDVRDARLISPFSQLSKMNFLGLFCTIGKMKLGYSFFKRAIDDIALDIPVMFEDDDHRAAAALFLSLLRLNMDEDGALDFVVEEYEKYLPMEMRFLLLWEAKEISAKSDIVKKFEQKISKSLKGNKTLQSDLDKMLKISIRKVNK